MKPLIGIANSWSVETALRRAGAETVDIEDESDLEAVAQYLDGIVLTGGGDIDPARYGQTKSVDTYGIDQERDELEFKLVEVARDKGINIMGICRGAQLLNVAHGGTLYQDIEDFVTHSHWGYLLDVLWRAGSGAAQSLSDLTIEASHYHHQSIDRVGEGLVAAAWSHDGIVEAVESMPNADIYMLGTQFHPEMDYTTDRDALRLFEHFVKQTRPGKGREALAKRLYAYNDATYKVRKTVTNVASKLYTTSNHFSYGNYAKLGSDSRVDSIRGTEDDDMPAFLQGYNDDWDLAGWETTDSIITPQARNTLAWREHCDEHCDAGQCWNVDYCDPDTGICEERLWKEACLKVEIEDKKRGRGR
jgi:gamma-glutamyl-gamma-aminobutyrate hydrolase PuuD